MSVDAAPIPLNDEAPRKPRGFRAVVQTRDMHSNVRYRASFPAARGLTLVLECILVGVEFLCLMADYLFRLRRASVRHCRTFTSQLPPFEKTFLQRHPEQKCCGYRSSHIVSITAVGIGVSFLASLAAAIDSFQGGLPSGFPLALAAARAGLVRVEMACAYFLQSKTQPTSRSL